MPVKRSSSPGRKGVADLDGAVVGQADDVAGKSLSAISRSRARKEGRVAEADLAAEAAVERLHAALEAARADPQERHAVAVVGVHVRLDLEDEAAEFRLGRLDLARIGTGSPGASGLGRRGPVIAARGSGGGARRMKASKQLAHAEVVHGGAEEAAGSACRRR
jgi:hypothetical protein